MYTIYSVKFVYNTVSGITNIALIPFPRGIYIYLYEKIVIDLAHFL